MKAVLLVICLFSLTYASPLYRRKRSSDSSEEQVHHRKIAPYRYRQWNPYYSYYRPQPPPQRQQKLQFHTSSEESLDDSDSTHSNVQQKWIPAQHQKNTKPLVKVQPVQKKLQSVSQETQEKTQFQENFKQGTFIDKNEGIAIEEQLNQNDCIIVGIKPGKDCGSKSDSADSDEDDDSEDSDSEDTESDESHTETTPSPTEPATTVDDFTTMFTTSDNSGRGDNDYVQNQIYSKKWGYEKSVEPKSLRLPKSKTVDQPPQDMNTVLKDKLAYNEAIEDGSSPPEVENQLDWTTESPQSDVVTTDSSSSQQYSNSTEDDSQAEDQSQQTEEEEENDDDSTEETSNEENEEEEENHVSSDSSNQEPAALHQEAVADDTSSNQTTESYQDSKNSSNQEDSESQDLSSMK
ncbi:clumping factor A-like isoform X2 [Protopterus annectens]|uniref:clumping factor A-like isoform X2 n=1 Tax=Protopterus annectens TaxID=7888 RepID=UPI001CFAC9AF|nr:clumping factor A-like isoform X2 [Protopterus annectens]